MAGIVAEKMIEMFVVLIAGMIIYKCKLANARASKTLSNLLLMVVSPLLILESYQMPFDWGLFYGLLWTF